MQEQAAIYEDEDEDEENLDSPVELSDVDMPHRYSKDPKRHKDVIGYYFFLPVLKSCYIVKDKI